MSRYLVTGGAGFIGSHIVEKLVSTGEKVRVLDNFSSGKMENLKFTAGLSSDEFEIIKGDIRDIETCKKACAGVDYVLHQAALRSVPKSMLNPHEYNVVNIDGILNMLEAAKECAVKRFVFASSSSVYGDTDKFPEREDAYPLLISPYALSKLAGEYYCRIFSENYGLETVSLRYFNVFGPRQALDDEYAVVIPKFITCILNGQPPPIHGTGKQSRDFTFIDNVVQANLLAANTPNIKCEVFNVANGRDNSVLDIVAVANQITGKSIKPVFEPKRAGDVFRTLADISKIKRMLKYTPHIDFKEGLKRTIEWFSAKK
ncbi:MAG: SDR family oxidoreductase [Candidatus Omnitrophota bacterium]|nr:SDR family oxidoreductase [Candidatus Omnitrophota bacterium]